MQYFKSINTFFIRHCSITDSCSKDIRHYPASPPTIPGITYPTGKLSFTSFLKLKHSLKDHITPNTTVTYFSCILSEPFILLFQHPSLLAFYNVSHATPQALNLFPQSHVKIRCSKMHQLPHLFTSFKKNTFSSHLDNSLI